MPRIRTLKPEIWQDEALGSCPPVARLLYIGLITQADDDGRFRAAPALVKSAVFPYDLKLGLGTIEGHLECLAEAALIRLYTVKGQSFGDLPSWGQHQKINRPSPSSIPSFEKRDKHEQTPPFAGDSVNGHGILSEDSVKAHGGKGKEGKGSKKHVELSADAQQVWDAYHGYHPKAQLTTTGKNHRKGIIERALTIHDADTCTAAVHGIHSNTYLAENGHAGNLELTLRDADHIEKYAAMWEPQPANSLATLTAEDFDRMEAERERITAQRRAALTAAEKEG